MLHLDIKIVQNYFGMKNKKLARKHDPPTLNDFFVAALK